MIKSGSFSFAGKCHGLIQERNEDVVLERDCGTHKAAVLCDGAGGCPYGRTAAELTAGAVAEFLSLHFRRCLLEQPELLRRELVQLVTRTLTQAAKQAGADPGQFGCTILAAAMDGQGRWCLFHLGDGIAVGKLGTGSDWMVLSYPQRGLVPGGTSLTMNGPMFQNLRFYRQTSPDSRSLLLMSDGALELFSAAQRLLKKPEAPEDDCSAAWLTGGGEF